MYVALLKGILYFLTIVTQSITQAIERQARSVLKDSYHSDSEGDSPSRSGQSEDDDEDTPQMEVSEDIPLTKTEAPYPPIQVRVTPSNAWLLCITQDTIFVLFVQKCPDQCRVCLPFIYNVYILDICFSQLSQSCIYQ